MNVGSQRSIGQPVNRLTGQRVRLVQLTDRPIDRLTISSAFTMTELLVVIAIIILLTGLLTPVVIKARYAGQRAATQQFMATLTTACQTFERDTGFLPPSDFNSPDVRKIAPAEAVNMIAEQWNGGELLFQALVGPMDNDEDGQAGNGFRTGLNSRVYGPYLDVKSSYSARREKIDPASTIAGDGEWWQDPDNVRDTTCFVFVDTWKNPICYYKARPFRTNTDDKLVWGDADDPNPDLSNVRFDENDNTAIDDDFLLDIGDPAYVDPANGSPFLGGADPTKPDPPPADDTQYEDPIDHSQLLSAKTIFYSRGRDGLNTDGIPTNEQSVNKYRRDDIIVIGQ